MAGPTVDAASSTSVAEALAAALTPWYAAAARDLPWRRPAAGPWGVLVSEVMLQQTPVVRVLPVYDEWLERWPSPAALAAAAPGDAVRAWGRLGYPRRALRLHEAARAIVGRHGGEVPRDVDALLALPGVGDYTARAVAAFAFGQRHPVVDTNVRRVIARVVGGVADTRPCAARDLPAAEALLPEDPASAAAFAAALMELGATVCTSRSPRCAGCPLEQLCQWRAVGLPPPQQPLRRSQPWVGTDRQARGRLLRVACEAAGPVTAATLTAAWPDRAQQRRALDGLISDGLLVRCPGGRVGLPS